MKKFIFPILAVVITMTLASCDWDPTGHGNGGGGHGGGGNDGGGRDTVVVDTNDHDRGQFFVILNTGEEVTTPSGKIVRLVSIEKNVDPIRNEGTSLVIIEVSIDGGITYKTITLTLEEPVYEDEDCRIELGEIHSDSGVVLSIS